MTTPNFHRVNDQFLRLLRGQVSQEDVEDILHTLMSIGLTVQTADAVANALLCAQVLEPFGYFRADPMGWTDCAADDDGAIALYEHPPAPAVPQGMRLVPVWLLKNVEQSLGSFMSDLGWAQADMDTMDSVSALLAANPAPAPAVPQGWTKAADQVPLEADGEVFIRFTDGSIGTGWATYWHGASNEFAQWTFPDPDEDRTVLEWTKNPATPAPAPAQESGESVQLRGLDDSSAMLRVRTILESKACYLAGSTIAEIVAAAQPAQEAGLIARQFDLICQAIDKADDITMDGDYMLDSGDCIAVVRVMQALFEISALRAKGGK